MARLQHWSLLLADYIGQGAAGVPEILGEIRSVLTTEGIMLISDIWAVMIQNPGSPVSRLPGALLYYLERGLVDKI